MESQRRTIEFVTALALAATMWASLSAQADPFVGTWKVDVAKSQYSPGPAPKSQTVTYEAVGKAMKITSESINADGSKTLSVFTSELDGKEVPIEGSRTADMVSFKRVDSHTTERIDKIKGKVTMRYKSVVAPDGKTRVSTQTGTDAQGTPVNNSVFYTKQ
ncbi:MAG TPA: hypothetical protein VE420_10255 [Gemmatimonadales bacterium]|nr:hypothetical protein [Gemmatimonadales bacterium]